MKNKSLLFFVVCCLLLASTLPVSAEEQASSRLYLPVVGYKWSTVPQLHFVETDNDGENYCIWEITVDDPGRNRNDCTPIPLSYINQVVALQTSLGSVHEITKADDSFKMYESNISYHEIDLPMLSRLNFGSLQQQGEDSGKVNLSAQMMIPPGQSLEELIRQMRLATFFKKMGSGFKWPVHQSQVLFATPGIPGDPIFLWEHCRDKKDHFSDGAVTFGTITNWQTDTTGAIYAQMAFEECTSASGKWVPIASLWALAISKNIVSENDLNSQVPTPPKRTVHARVRMPSGEELLTAIEVTALVLGTVAIIILAAPELVALATYMSGWMLTGYVLSTAVGPHRE